MYAVLPLYLFFFKLFKFFNIKSYRTPLITVLYSTDGLILFIIIIIITINCFPNGVSFKENARPNKIKVTVTTERHIHSFIHSIIHSFIRSFIYSDSKTTRV